MRAIVVFEAGPPENLLVREVGSPELEARSVLVRTRFAGVNHGDVIRRKRGLFPINVAPPHILGFEGSGDVVAVGAAVGRVKVGDRVGFLVTQGAYAELVSVPEPQVLVLPGSVDEATAAGAICSGTTALNLVRLAAAEAGQWVLVHGAAGGVGSALVQVARQAGLRVIGSVGSEEKAAFVTELGVDSVVVHTVADFAEVALELTGGVGVDVVFDCVGQAVLEGNLRALREGGLLLYYGSTSGHPAFPGSSILMKSLRIQGFVVFDLFRQAERWTESLALLGDALQQGRLRVPIARTLRMEEAAEAHRLIEDRLVQGKLLLDMQ